MISRRRFLRSAQGGAVFAACTCGGLHAWGQGAEGPPRKQVLVAGTPANVIDFHAHCIIPEVADLVRETPLARSLPKTQIITGDRIRALDARGIDTQVLSINQFWWYGADETLARRIVETQDHGLAALCSDHSGRFLALTSPALQFPDLAAEQLDYAVAKLGFRGASVGGHVNGEVPSSPRFDALWRKAQDLDVPVFIHPNSAENVTRDGAWAGRGDLGNIIGNPLETTVFLSRMIFDGTLDRFPRLKIIGAHGGGYLPSYFERTNVACEVRESAKCLNKKKPRDYLKDQIFVDSMVFTPEGLRHLVAEMGPSQIVYGSDMPFVWPDTIDTITALPDLSDEDRRSILSGTVAKLLRL